ncbi:MAG: hypothetical protein BGO55_05920 [Sphingobacteriales bacterium 50-39]|nr:hypothetical protein [Sphingobacteriales bacterium]OJW56125.1 MAG: hypothetical protein BGO55_05920 [Sphingobacteriales bacterium 50-39]
MKRLSPFGLLLIVALSFSCKKLIQQQEQQAVLNIITNGNWYVYQYLQGDSNITANFSGYLFKFTTYGTVTGTKGGVSSTGTWSADINARTITSNFPSAGPPVSLLNGIWKIKDSGTDFVLATYTDTTTHIPDTLRLQKQ